MYKTQFNEFQIIDVLKSVEAGRTVQEVCQEVGISETSYYAWKEKYEGMEYVDITQIKGLREENRRLREKYAALTLENQALKDILEKKS